MTEIPFYWEEFLRRPPITVCPVTVRKALAGKRILITGAGGCIGSSLAQACRHLKPAALVLLDSSEKSIYDLDSHLGDGHHSLVGDVCNAALLEEVFSAFRPQVVFHAAACKHVPLMEKNAFTAAYTNVLGTQSVLRAAARYGAEQLILLSTDKAAGPCSVMGATKRVAELLVLANHSRTQAKAVRLGNVLGSSGSVVPLFEKQIASGGPVTITHPQAARYFMTLSEAVSLLQAAAALSVHSTVLVPPLNGPHRIEELARFLMEKHHRPVEILYTQLRPGEKLQESLLSEDESLEAEPEGPLRRVLFRSMPETELQLRMDALEQALRTRDLGLLLQSLTALVPEYRPSADLLQKVPTS
jgi:FlaA1/EpsC-like NDP-sugar epimerase